MKNINKRIQELYKHQPEYGKSSKKLVKEEDSELIPQVYELVKSGSRDNLEMAEQFCSWLPITLEQVIKDVWGELLKLLSDYDYDKPNYNIDETVKLFSKQNLGLSAAGLTHLPESVGRLINLELLFLYYNQLTTLPESVGQLTNLKELYLFHNLITTLPESINQLTNLETLDLENNQLTVLPKSVIQLNNLKILRLNNNNLKSLPESIGGLKNLEVLYLSNNELTELPQSLDQLKNLEELNLGDNPLNPEDVEKLKESLPNCTIDFY